MNACPTMIVITRTRYSTLSNVISLSQIAQSSIIDMHDFQQNMYRRFARIFSSCSCHRHGIRQSFFKYFQTTNASTNNNISSPVVIENLCANIFLRLSLPIIFVSLQSRKKTIEIKVNDIAFFSLPTTTYAVLPEGDSSINIV